MSGVPNGGGAEPTITPGDDAAVEGAKPGRKKRRRGPGRSLIDGRLLRRYARSYVRRSRTSIGVAIILLLAAVGTGTIVAPASRTTEHLWASGVHTTVDAVHWWSAVTTLVVPADPVQLVVGILAALVLLAGAERSLGSLRTLGALVLTGVVGVLIGVALQWLGSLVGEWWAEGTSSALTLDPLTGIVGALITATGFMVQLWRRRIRVVTFSFIVIFALYDGDPANVYRMFAGLAGLLLGTVLARRGVSRRFARSSHREVRNLLAAVVAVTAIGPLVTLLSRSDIGPFFFLGDLFTRSFPQPDDGLSRCSSASAAAHAAAHAAAAASSTAVPHCGHHDLVAISLSAGGPVLLLFVPLVLLLVSAIGLRRGRRLALHLAVGVNVALAALAFSSLDVIANLRRFSAVGEYAIWAVAAVVVPAVTAVLLIAAARYFRVRAPRASVIRWSVVVAVAFVVLAGLYLVFGLANADGFVPSAPRSGFVIDALRRFVPLSFLWGTGRISLPTDDVTFVLHSWVGPLFWLVVVIAVLALFRATTVSRTAGEQAALRTLLRAGGGGTLGYLGTWPGNAHWFTADGSGAVSYRVINGVALTMSDPVCPPDLREATVAGFIGFCDENGWTPVFYSIHDDVVPIFTRMGWRAMSVGEETLMHPQTFDLTGKMWQKVRQPLNKAITAGVTAQWTSWSELSIGMLARITELSEQWIAEKELPEMGFTLGGLDELDDPETALMLAIGPDGELQAITSWLPSYRDGVVVGWTLDFMRRADGAMNGIMEFLIASAAIHMRGEAVEILSLSGAPLAKAPAGSDAAADARDGAPDDDPGLVPAVLDYLAKSLEPAYGFSSLFRFKAKFNPTYSTIWMAYADPLALPAIGAALGRAYLPDVSAREALALVRSVRSR